MLTYRLTNSLIPSQDSEWKQLVTSVLGEGVHTGRVRGFCLSREALRQCFEEKKIPLEISDLVLENFRAVKSQNLLTISLSHTSEWGAAVIANVNEFISVGIDIEPLSREVKPKIVERISHPEDSKLPALSLWTLKEAAFKTVMNTGKFEHPFEFSSLKISQGKWVHESSHTQGEWKLEEQHGMLLALAWIKI